MRKKLDRKVLNLNDISSNKRIDNLKYKSFEMANATYYLN